MHGLQYTMSQQPAGAVKHLGNHVAALARTKDPLALAEELLCKKEHNLELQQQLVCARLNTLSCLA